MSLMGKARALARASKSGARWVKPTTLEEFRALIGFAPRRHQLEILLQATTRFAVHICHRRFGKALALDTPVPMADGSWSTMGELQAGDRILGSHGEPITVTFAHDVMEGRPCFEVEFASGQVIVADAEHLWATTRKKDRHNPVRTPEGRVNSPRGPSVRDTSEIASTLRSRGEFNHRVALAGPAQYPVAQLPIDPYLLGLWLGDGTSRRADITGMDGLEGAFREAGYPVWSVAEPGGRQGRAGTWHIGGGFQKSLRLLGVLGPGAKHIPEAYQRASVEQRLALLQGLMDTDGSVSAKCNAFCEVSFIGRLSADTARLIRSLGMQVNAAPHHGAIRLTFAASVPVFRLPRKASVLSMRKATEQSIVRCEPCPSVPVRCITVDAPNSLYLVGEHFIPTHNSVLFINYLVERAYFCPFDLGEYAYAAPTYKQAERIAWKYLEKACRNIPGAVFKKSDLEVTIPTLRGSTATIRLFGLDNPKQSLRGAYLDGVVFDESSGIPRMQWTQVVRPMLADDCRRGEDILGRPNQWAEFIGTVTGRDWFWQLYADAKLYMTGGFTVEVDERTGRSTKVFSEDWTCGLYRADETGIISPEELESIKRENPDDFAQEFLCDPDASMKGSVYGFQLDLAATTGGFVEVPIDRSLPVNTAWDLGWDDATAIWFFQTRGEIVVLIDYLEVNHTDLETLAHELHTRSHAGKAFRYGYHLLPHDVEVHEIGKGTTRKDILKSAGLQRVYTVPRRNEPDLIAAARKLIPKCIFSLSATAAGVSRLRQYSRTFNEKTQIYSLTPKHDENSHAASAFQQLAIGLRKEYKSGSDPNNARGAEV